MPQPHLLPFQQNRIFTLNEPNAPRLNPALACEIGLNESVILLQLEFWIAISNNERDDMFWTYQSVRDMRATFPFWSLDTINRAIKSLEKNGFIITTTKYNPLKYDKTRWFTLNFPNLEKLESISIKGHRTRSTQNRTGSTQDHTGSMQDHTAPPIYPLDITRDSRPSARETTPEKSLKTTTTAPVASPPTLTETPSLSSSPFIINDIKEQKNIVPVESSQIITNITKNENDRSLNEVRSELIALVPDKHRQPIVTKFIHETFKSGINSDTIKSAILYTNSHAKGNTKQYRSYLGKTLENPNWHIGYLELVELENQQKQEIENLKALKLVQEHQERKEQLLKKQQQDEERERESKEVAALMDSTNIDELDKFIETECWSNMNKVMKNLWKQGARHSIRRLHLKKFIAANGIVDKSSPATFPATVQPVPVVSEKSTPNGLTRGIFSVEMLQEMRQQPTA